MESLLRFLSGTSKLFLPPSLHRFRISLSIEHVVPPSEAASEVTNEFLVMNIMVFGASPEWQEVVKRPGKFISGVGVNCLEQPQGNPDVHREDVEISSHSTPHNWYTDCSETQHHNFNG